MDKRAYVIKVDGTQIELEHRPTLKEAQQIVGGYIEFAHCQNPARTLVVNEEGIPRGLPFNGKATGLYQQGKRGIVNIYGDAIVLEGWKTVGA